MTAQKPSDIIFVVDNSGYVPRHVRDSAELLKGRCGRYIYTSTVSVYDFDKSLLAIPKV